MGYGGTTQEDKKHKKDKKSKKNATFADEVGYAVDPFSQGWGSQEQSAPQMQPEHSHQQHHSHRRHGHHGHHHHHHGNHGHSQNSLGDHHVHIKDRYHGVRAYDPWKEIPERPELEPFYTDRLQETLGSDYLPHKRETLPQAQRGRATELLHGGPVVLAGGAANSTAYPVGPPPPSAAGSFLRNIVPAFRDENKNSRAAAGSASFTSTAPPEPLAELAWWPLPRRAAAARSAASTLGVKLDNVAPGAELWHSVTGLSEAFMRATPEAPLCRERGRLPLDRWTAYSPREYYMGDSVWARPRTPPWRPRSISPPRTQQLSIAPPRSSLRRPRSSSPSRPMSHQRSLSPSRVLRSGSISPYRPLHSSSGYSDWRRSDSDLRRSGSWGTAAPGLTGMSGFQPQFSDRQLYQGSSGRFPSQSFVSGSVLAPASHERLGAWALGGSSRVPLGGSRTPRTVSSVATSAASGFAGRAVPVS